jgi:hypothetical protein
MPKSIQKCGKVMGEIYDVADREVPVPAIAKHGAVFGSFLLCFALALANETFDWRVVGDYDWEAVVAVVVLGSVAMTGSVWSALRR